GKLSGRNAFRTRLKELGIAFDSEEALNAAFVRFKDPADKKSETFDEDLQALVSDVVATAADETYRLVSLEAHSRTGDKPKATLVLQVAGTEHTITADGDGPVDAALKAIEQVACSQANLKLYSVNAITSGTDSQ